MFLKGDVRGNYIGATLVGVTSRGLGCARPDSPGIYASVQSHTPWILEKLGNIPTFLAGQPVPSPSPSPSPSLSPSPSSDVPISSSPRPSPSRPSPRPSPASPFNASSPTSPLNGSSPSPQPFPHNESSPASPFNGSSPITLHNESSPFNTSSPATPHNESSPASPFNGSSPSPQPLHVQNITAYLAQYPAVTRQFEKLLLSFQSTQANATSSPLASPHNHSSPAASPAAPFLNLASYTAAHPSFGELMWQLIPLIQATPWVRAN